MALCCLALILSAFSPALAQKEARVAIVLPFKATGEEGRRSLDFYRGFLLAADHLKSQGISARITALDEGQESAYIEPALNAAAPSADALVGFAFHSHALEAAKFGLSHEMPVVFPLTQSIKTGMESNAYAAFLVPDDEAWAQGISQMLTGALGRTQVLVLQSETTEMSQRTQRLTELLDKSGAKVKVLPISATPYNIADALSSKRMNLVVTAATEKDILRNVAQKLRSVGQANPKKTLAVVGHPAWYDYYKTGELKWEDVEVYIPVMNFYNIASEQTKTLMEQYSYWFRTKPADTIPHSFLLGYDAGMHIIARLAEEGRGFLKDEKKYGGLYTDIILKQSHKSSCRSNHAVRLLNIKASGAIDLLAF